MKIQKFEDRTNYGHRVYNMVTIEVAATAQEVAAYGRKPTGAIMWFSPEGEAMWTFEIHEEFGVGGVPQLDPLAVAAFSDLQYQLKEQVLLEIAEGRIDGISGRRGA